jgi:hypothetical protein
MELLGSTGTSNGVLDLRVIHRRRPAGGMTIAYADPVSELVGHSGCDGSSGQPVQCGSRPR